MLNIHNQPERKAEQRSKDMGRKRQSEKTKDSRRVEDERRLRRHLPDRNPKFPFLVADTQTCILETEAEREKQKR